MTWSKNRGQGRKKGGGAIMRELTRSNDPVFLSYLAAELRRAGIEPVALDGFAASVLEPMNLTAQQRIMVEDADYWDAWAILAEAEERLSEDTLLDGRVHLLQPKDGFRAAIDPVILAASIPVENGDRVLDVGTGSGAAALCLLARCPWAWVEGIDVQAGLIALAKRSAERSGMSERVRFTVADVAEAPLADRQFDHVMSNPPFLPKDHGQMPKGEARALATVESTADLSAWLAFMAARVTDGGTLSVIHRADRADEIVSHLAAFGIGALRRLDLVPVDDGRPVKRCLLQGEKGASGATSADTRLVLHEADGSFTGAATAVLRHGAPVCLERPRTNP